MLLDIHSLRVVSSVVLSLEHAVQLPGLRLELLYVRGTLRSLLHLAGILGTGSLLLGGAELVGGDILRIVVWHLPAEAPAKRRIGSRQYGISDQLWERLC